MNKFLKICHDLEIETRQILHCLQRAERFGRETLAIIHEMAKERSHYAARLLEQAEHQAGIPCDLAFPRLLRQQVRVLLDQPDLERLSEVEAVRTVKGLAMRRWDFYLHNALSFHQEGLKTLFIEIARHEHRHVLTLGRHFLALTATELREADQAVGGLGS
jgi:rubrerythrin